MKIFIISSFCFFMALQSFCQHRRHYKFIVENPIIIDSASKIYVGINFEFEYTRRFKSQNIFVDNGIFTSNKRALTTATFKKETDAWYLKNRHGKWILFYSDTCKVQPTPEIYIMGSKYFVHWLMPEKLSSQKKISLVFTIRYHKYYFDRDEGIIAVESNGTIFVRNDLLK